LIADHHDSPLIAELVGPEHVVMNVLASRKGSPVQRALHEFGVTERGLRSWLASN